MTVHPICQSVHRVKLGWNDKERATALLTRTVGRRLTLRQPKEANT